LLLRAAKRWARSDAPYLTDAHLSREGGLLHLTRFRSTASTDFAQLAPKTEQPAPKFEPIPPETLLFAKTMAL
jgi:hypothetical protein